MLKKIIISVLIASGVLFASGGYDHGTSTGKGHLELDLTWNPFNLIEFGQTYVVAGYGITERLDIHGYFAHQAKNQNNYYYGIFYQFVDIKYLDLATAVGKRHYTHNKAKDIFFPQLLFNVKANERFTIGGAFVNIQRMSENVTRNKGTAFDIAIYLPVSDLIILPKYIQELKFAIGLFNPGIFDSDHGDFLPTYSIDIIFKKFRRNKN